MPVVMPALRGHPDARDAGIEAPAARQTPAQEAGGDDMPGQQLSLIFSLFRAIL